MATHQLCDISEIRPYLFLSGFGCITEKKLRARGITHIVDATNIPKNPQYDGTELLNVQADDSLIADLTPYFVTVSNFVQGAKKKDGKTLIYCAAGVSRSAALCMMCLVLGEGISLRDAYFNILEKRPFISPNIAFWRQMVDFERKQCGKNTIQLLRGMRRPIPDVYIRRRTKEKTETLTNRWSYVAESTPVTKAYDKEVESKA